MGVHRKRKEGHLRGLVHMNFLNALRLLPFLFYIVERSTPLPHLFRHKNGIAKQWEAFNQALLSLFSRVIEVNLNSKNVNILRQRVDASVHNPFTTQILVAISILI